jgi:tRNA threonylcarbamoyladenosine biosynthesis protein TsaE
MADKLVSIFVITKLIYNKNNMAEFTCKSENIEETQALAAAIGAVLRGREVIEFISDIGGGKTAFVKGLAKGLGITEIVQSPTFTISRIYNGRDDLELHHFDFYRLSEAGIVADELAESLQQPNVVVAVEWGEIVHDVLPAHRITIRLTSLGENERKIEILTPIGFEYIDDAIAAFKNARHLA